MSINHKVHYNFTGSINVQSHSSVLKRNFNKIKKSQIQFSCELFFQN